MTTPAPTLPAESLLDLASRRVPPFDRAYWLAAIDGTALNPPMLVEGVNEYTMIDGSEPEVLLSVWPADRRMHVMHGIMVDRYATLTIEFNEPA